MVKRILSFGQMDIIKNLPLHKYNNHLTKTVQKIVPPVMLGVHE